MKKLLHFAPPAVLFGSLCTVFLYGKHLSPTTNVVLLVLCALGFILFVPGRH